MQEEKTGSFIPRDYIWSRAIERLEGISGIYMHELLSGDALRIVTHDCIWVCRVREPKKGTVSIDQAFPFVKRQKNGIIACSMLTVFGMSGIQGLLAAGLRLEILVRRHALCRLLHHLVITPWFLRYSMHPAVLALRKIGCGKQAGRLDNWTLYFAQNGIYKRYLTSLVRQVYVNGNLLLSAKEAFAEEAL